jgi:transcriptional regulator with XRE-family HTH domain
MSSKIYQDEKTHAIVTGIMPRASKLKLPPLKLGKESLGQRIARLRKERGYTQIDLAKKIGITQALVSDYERNRLRPHHEMVIRFALALEVSADELLGLKQIKDGSAKPNLKLVRRLKKIEALPAAEQKILLRTIDTFLKGAAK